MYNIQNQPCTFRFFVLSNLPHVYISPVDSFLLFARNFKDFLFLYSYHAFHFFQFLFNCSVFCVVCFSILLHTINILWFYPNQCRGNFLFLLAVSITDPVFLSFICIVFKIKDIHNTWFTSFLWNFKVFYRMNIWLNSKEKYRYCF